MQNNDIIPKQHTNTYKDGITLHNNNITLQNNITDHKHKIITHNTTI